MGDACGRAEPNGRRVLGWRPCARRTLPLADVAEGYRAMDERGTIKTLLLV